MNRPSEEELRKQLIGYCHRVHSAGWVANHDGNLTARLGEDRLLCTPTAMSKADILPEMLIIVNGDNEVIAGKRRAFSELQLHRAAYSARPDIGCVIHAHPPTATGFAVAGIGLSAPFMAEPVVSLGARIPLVPFFPPKDPRLDEAIAEGLQDADVLLLENHGALSVGGSFEQAFLRLELLEHIAKIALVSHQLGGAKALDPDLVRTLAKRGRPLSVPDHSPPGEGPRANGRPTGQSVQRPNVNRLVRDALRRLD
jgi:L-fuculose-phosphate aldolase